MKKNLNDEKIMKYLDELAEEYKSLLYKKLIESNKDLDHLSISELLRLDSEIKKPLIEEKNNRKKLTYIMAITGIIYAMAGIVFFIVLNSDINITSKEFLPLSISFGGALIALLSFFIAKIVPTKTLTQQIEMKNGKKDSSQIEYQIISTWRDIEGISNELTSLETARPGNTPIDKLTHNDLINDVEEKSLRELLSLRNRIVHEKYTSIDITHAIKVIDTCNIIFEKLKKIL